MKKMKWAKKMPRRQGLYLVKYPQDNFLIKYEILNLMRAGKKWLVADYPNLRVTDPVEEVNCEWGPRIE